MLFEILLLACICAIALQFWKLRALAETAHAYLKQYCDTHQLQLISIARIKTRLTTWRGKITWKAEYAFEFSGNGEDRYTGHITLLDNTVTGIDIPPHRIN
ncbi:DUF3301 domain-containing protein [Aestuariibacter salexigens]|uniref:DUF3301 domain-containing protein n=1 Tax=Aestuariibacter salexigens TaxID=226010 RepID=UPI00040D1BED|nr:DUF3301 domain-containing protein [Aestuariibacter salexigens]